MAHAKLSPSSATRWLTCTPSATFEEKYADTAGEAAKEGTLAHELSEYKLMLRLGRGGRERVEDCIKDVMQSPFYNAEMDSRTDEYVDYVIERYNEALAIDPKAMIFLEQKVDLTDYVPDGFGTRDCAIVYNGKVLIIDLKYGKGVPVSAFFNKQMMLYAVGTVKQFDMLYTIDEVEMVIHQPRLNGADSHSMLAAQLETWAETELAPKARMAFNGEGEFVAGPHCQFCKGKNDCRTRMEYVMEAAKPDLMEFNRLAETDILMVLNRGDELISWVKGIQDRAFQEALAGKSWVGFKLVEGRSNRQITDPAEVQKRVLAAGIPEDKLFKPQEMVSLTELEKLVGKKAFAQISEGLIHKPQGKPTLVEAVDPRPVFNSAAADFADLVEMEEAPATVKTNEPVDITPAPVPDMVPVEPKKRKRRTKAEIEAEKAAYEKAIDHAFDPAALEKLRATEAEFDKEFSDLVLGVNADDDDDFNPLGEPTAILPRLYWAQHCLDHGPAQYTLVQVSGSPVNIIGGFNFFMHRGHNDSSKWAISEERSGCEVSEEFSSPEAAITDARKKCAAQSDNMKYYITMAESRLKMLIKNKQ